jgi:hypothetical protein
MVRSQRESDFIDAIVRYRELSEDDCERVEKAAKRLREENAFHRRGVNLDMTIIDRELPNAAKVFFDNMKLHNLARDDDELGGWIEVREAAHNLQSAISRLHEPWRSLLDIQLEEAAGKKRAKRLSQLNNLRDRLNALRTISSSMITGANEFIKRGPGRRPIRADVDNSTPLLMALWISATGKPLNSSFDLVGGREYRDLGVHFIQVVLQAFDPKVTRQEVRTAITHAKGRLL